MKTIIIILGYILAIWVILDIFKKDMSMAGKIICTLVLLLTSWVGVLVYFLWAKDHVTEWFK